MNWKLSIAANNSINTHPSLKRVKRVSLNMIINPLSANFTKWWNTFKQFVGKLPTNCLSVFDHFVKLALKRLKYLINIVQTCIILSVNLGTEALTTCTVLSILCKKISNDINYLPNPMIPFVTLLLQKYPFY